MPSAFLIYSQIVVMDIINLSGYGYNISMLHRHESGVFDFMI